ncbi:hypothetical protein [Streptomyces klenkii]|uniref:hypothetical protein n=1 Tax=Streptomyces klenkii TaxID=1420899 RepID=UPI00341A38F9
MTSENPIRTRFSFAPPVDDALAWNLRLDVLAQAIEEAFPGAWTKAEGRLGPRPSEALSFEIQAVGDAWVEGTATSPIEGAGAVVVDATVQEASVFARWLRDSFIPSPDLIEFSSEFAMNRGDFSTWQLPRTGPAEDIAAALQAHIDAALRL